ncbi:LSU ribosomal protein L10p (P0) [Mucinivorans hirudinis]|uniref:Large ribosomal subunit protein uL10 n=1 Tax=Mucinivorans hirudinis TaxID=1433126 RepID=A0A060R7W3_9BACT|nr:LSU ribosomal protein L10p (P0) [Mucinivorans hirudinis]
MRKEEKTEVIQSLTSQLGEWAHYYVTDISGLNAEKTAALRRLCFEKGIKLVVVKNTLFVKALEAAGKANEEIEASMVGSSSIMFTNTGNLPAKLIKEFRKSAKSEKPLLKSAFVEECAYIGEAQLKALEEVKSREQLIGDIVALLQSPAKNVISALQGSAGHKIAGLVKTLQERGC